MPGEITWYFDPISPYVYLQLPDLDRLPAGVRVRPVPVLLAALLKRWGTKGPAEIPAKRLHTYRQCAWLAQSRHLTFCMPPRHPFNPLAALRLLCALGPTVEHAGITSRFVFERGGDPSTPQGLRELGNLLGVVDPEAVASDSLAKNKLRENTDEALAHEAWGVPTFRVGEELFWGADTFPMMLDYLRDPGIFATSEMTRIANLPVGASRT